MKRLALLALIVLVPTASAHIEFLPGQGASLAEAIWLGNAPVIQYDELPEHGGIRYYKIDLTANETVRVRLARNPESFATGIPPSLALMGPGLTPRGFRPSFLEVPPNLTADVHQGVVRDTLEYDAVAAIASGTLVDFDFTPPQSARYTLAVYDEDQGGAYLLQIGDFAPVGFHRHYAVPQTATELRAWEGQSWAHTSLPTLATIILGGLLGIWRTRGRGRLPTLTFLGLVGAVLILASGVSYIHQAVHHRELGLRAILLTLTIAASHLAIAACLAFVADKAQEPPRPAHRVAAIALGLLALLLWAGFIWGPGFVLAAGLFPQDKASPDEP